ncbi:MAG: hypothetical protein AB1758_26215, partial [Candidatus Eremiobacterota bacterium]
VLTTCKRLQEGGPGAGNRPTMARIVAWLACVPSIGALLCRVWEVSPMQPVVLFGFLPCCAILLALWRRGDREVSHDLSLGFLGGLLGTLGYDLARVPFHLAGFKVFAPISAYGVWICGADCWSGWTEAVGWAYHFSNGITFGVMYALVARNRHWAWAVLFAMALETGAILCPFGALFNLRGNYPGIAVAYLGHLAYGLPLGLVVQHAEASLDWLRRLPVGFKLTGLGLCLLGVLSPALRPGEPPPRGYRIGHNLQAEPSWRRARPGTELEVLNPTANGVVVAFLGERLSLPAGGRVILRARAKGVHPVVIEGEGLKRISFLIVEE